MLDETSSSEQDILVLKKKKELPQKGLLWLISIGYNSANLLLLNFFQFFAAAIVREGVLGFITAIRSLLSALFQGNIGHLSDKKGRKKLLLLGFFLCFVATTLLIFSHNQTMLIIISIIHAFSFSIIIPIWNSVQGDVTETEGRTSIMGKLSGFGQGVGVILMIIMAVIFFLLEYYTGFDDFTIQYGVIFGIGAVNLLIAAIGTLFLQETRKFDSSIKQPKILAAFRNKPYRRFIIVNVFFGISMAVLWPIYPVIQVNIVNLKIHQLTITAAIYAIAFGLGNFLGGYFADKIGRKPVLIFSRIIMFSVSLFYIPMVLLNSWYFAILTNIISGIGNGVFMVILGAYALDMSTEENHGSYSGLAQVTWGIATFIGSFISGFIIEYLTNTFGPVTMVISTTIAIAIMRIFASIGYFFVQESLPSKGEKKSSAISKSDVNV